MEFIFGGVSDINEYHINNNTRMIKEVYRDSFHPNKKEEITVILLNLNGLRTEEWAAKNNLIRDFILKTNVDIIVMQKTNINWNKVAWKDHWLERTI